MTGFRSFSFLFVKSFPVLSKGFEIETEMSIHAVEKNMKIENIIIEYRDRPKGSFSKLNTYSDTCSNTCSLNSYCCRSFSTTVDNINPIRKNNTAVKAINPETINVGKFGTSPV